MKTLASSWTHFAPLCVQRFAPSMFAASLLLFLFVRPVQVPNIWSFLRTNGACVGVRVRVRVRVRVWVRVRVRIRVRHYLHLFVHLIVFHKLCFSLS